MSIAKRVDEFVNDILKIAEYYFYYSTDIEIDRGKAKVAIIQKINEFVSKNKR